MQSLPTLWRERHHRRRFAHRRESTFNVPITLMRRQHFYLLGVLPLPVGAVTGRRSPAARRGQLRRCTSFGSPNATRNQRQLSGWSASRAGGGSPHAGATSAYDGHGAGALSEQQIEQLKAYYGYRHAFRALRAAAPGSPWTGRCFALTA